jgi:hypothetical protein
VREDGLRQRLGGVRSHPPSSGPASPAPAAVGGGRVVARRTGWDLESRGGGPGRCGWRLLCGGRRPCCVLSVSLGLVGRVGAAAKTCGAGAALPIPELKLKPPLSRSVCSPANLRFWWSLSTRSCRTGGWFWSLSWGNLLSARLATTRATPLAPRTFLKASLWYHPAPLLLCLGEIPSSSFGRRRCCGGAPLLGGAILELHCWWLNFCLLRWP